jgi:hypothetical protein
MTTAALIWFVDLCTIGAAPNEAQTLGRNIARQLNRKNDRVQVNRVFRRHSTVLPKINTWLTGQEMASSIRSKGHSLTSSTYGVTITAIQAILNGQAASTAWGMGKQRGIDAGFSTTMEAAALVGYLKKISASDWLPEIIYTNNIPFSEPCIEEKMLQAYVSNSLPLRKGLLFSQVSALRVASTLFEVNEDNIRQYAGIDPINDQSEAGLAVFGLIRLGLLSKAEKYFDVDDLKVAMKPIPETVLKVDLAPDL